MSLSPQLLAALVVVLFLETTLIIALVTRIVQASTVTRKLVNVASELTSMVTGATPDRGTARRCVFCEVPTLTFAIEEALKKGCHE